MVDKYTLEQTVHLKDVSVEDALQHLTSFPMSWGDSLSEDSPCHPSRIVCSGTTTCWPSGMVKRGSTISQPL